MAKTASQITWRKYIWKNRYLYLMCVPGLVFLIIFKYIPMYGIMMAFQDFNFKKGIFGSPFNNFANFKQLFGSGKFYTVFTNSIVLSVTRLVISFPIPIILALLLNEIHAKAYKRTTQTLMYVPHFISWVVLGGIATNFLSMTDGLVNDIIAAMGGTKINFLGSSEWFRTVIIVTNIWKEAGWGTIIYLAGLSAINPEYYEAATVDGATRWQCTRYITIPSLVSTIVVMLILNVGSIMDAGFDQVLNLYNSAVYQTGDIIDTYVYRYGLGDMKYSLATAVGLFKNVIAFVLVVGTNLIARRISGEGIW